MVARGEEAALSLGATESQLLEWSQLGESQRVDCSTQKLYLILFLNNVSRHNNNSSRTKSGQTLLRQQNKRNVN